MCRGWTQTLGHLYAFRDGEASATEAWRKTLADRATCEPAAKTPDPALAKLGRVQSLPARVWQEPDLV